MAKWLKTGMILQEPPPKATFEHFFKKHHGVLEVNSLCASLGEPSKLGILGGPDARPVRRKVQDGAPGAQAVILLMEKIRRSPPGMVLKLCK